MSTTSPQEVFFYQVSTLTLAAREGCLEIVKVLVEAGADVSAIETNHFDCALFGAAFEGHAFPNSAIFGLEWWQLDLGAWVIRTLEKLGLVWDVKKPTKSAIAAKKSAV